MLGVHFDEKLSFDVKKLSTKLAVLYLWSIAYALKKISQTAILCYDPPTYTLLSSHLQ